MNVTEYIALEMQKPFRPGQTDCANTADRWFTLRRGFSAMARFGRQVSSADDMREWATDADALVRGIKDVMSFNDVSETSEPKPGDIGIVVVADRACIALYNGDTWWSRDMDGFIVCDDSYRYVSWSVAECPLS